MEVRPPEATDTANGETLKLACMACIRGHRTKHCGSPACRDKVLWTVKRPGRPSNSCMCKFSGTGRCKCVIAKAQCPHKPKKGEKKTVDCRCDERGRLCCTLSAEQWQMLAKGEKPAVRFFRTQEELHADISGTPLPSGFNSDALTQGQSPFSTPRTPATSMAGLTNGSGRSTPQTPMSAVHHAYGSAQLQSLPQSPGGRPPARFGMMGIGAPMGGEDHVGKDVLAWQGQTPIAPTPRPIYPHPAAHQLPPGQMHSPLHGSQHLSLGEMPYAFDNGILQPPMFSPHHGSQPLSHPATPMHQPPYAHPHSQYSFDAVPPVTASLNGLSVATNGTLPATSGFDMDYFNFQFPGAICQQCGMADCTCRSCPTVLQNTMDGSWQQCCSRKHVQAGPHGGQDPAAKKSCCGSKTNSGPSTTALQPIVPTETNARNVSAHGTRSAGGCCAGSSTQDFAVDPFDFSAGPELSAHDPSHLNVPGAMAATPQNVLCPNQAPTAGEGEVLPDQGIPLPHTHPPDPFQSGQHHDDPFAAPLTNPEAELDFLQDPLAEWQDPGDIDMDFDEFIQEAGCGCGTNCPCGMEDGGEMDMESGDSPASPATAHGGGGGGCCGGGGGG